MGATTADVLQRLASIEGHVHGIHRMYDDGQACLAVMRQTYAVRRALDKLEAVLAAHYLDQCVRERCDDLMMDEVNGMFAIGRGQVGHGHVGYGQIKYGEVGHGHGAAVDHEAAGPGRST